MGDGLLAVFPVAEAERLPCPVCDEALRRRGGGRGGQHGAERARAAAEGEPALAVDVALHFGEVVYGNVGASRRLDFTVIGRAVNEASRMEALCDRIGRNVILSETFARRCARPTVAVGAFALRGIAGDRAIFAVRDEAPSAGRAASRRGRRRRPAEADLDLEVAGAAAAPRGRPRRRAKLPWVSPAGIATETRRTRVARTVLAALDDEAHRRVEAPAPPAGPSSARASTPTLTRIEPSALRRCIRGRAGRARSGCAAPRLADRAARIGPERGAAVDHVDAGQ